MVIGFELDKNYGRVQLDFDQEVVADSFDIGAFSLQASAAASPGSPLFFMQSAVFNNLTEQGNTTSLYFFISRDDFARLMLQPTIASTEASTYVALGDRAVRSPFGRFNDGQDTAHAFGATSFIPDESPVYVTDFAIDMENQEMTLNFSEPVNPDSLDVSGLMLQSRGNVFAAGTRVSLTSADAAVIAVANYQRQLSFSLGSRNYNLINAGDDLCTERDNCFASAAFPFIRDVAGNPVSVQGFNENFGMSCSNYSRDTTPPALLWWELNLGRGEVNIVFSEPVHMPFFNYSAVLICNNETLQKSTVVMRVKWPQKYYFENTHYVNFTLLAEQVNFLKEMDAVASSMNDTFLILEPGVVTDTARLANRYQGLDASPQEARQARKVHQDIVDPEVIHVVLNMQDWYLRLDFSEVVDVSRIDLREAALLSARQVDQSTELLYLADPATLNRQSIDIAMLRETEDSTRLHIEFTNVTVTKIKNMMFLGHSVDKTFFAMTYKFIVDLNNNPVRTIYYSLAYQVDEFYPDVLSPRLLSWDADLSQDRIVLFFSEPINVTSINFAEMRLSSDGTLSRATAIMSPTRGSFVSNAIVNKELFEVHILLSYEDANVIKRKNSPRLCATAADCYLLLSADFAVDTLSLTASGQLVQNKLEPFGPARGAGYVEDDVSPHLLSYALDMRAGSISVTFSEPISVGSLNTTGITLYPSATSTEGLSLSRFSFSSEGEDTETVNVILSRDDHLRIKMFEGLAEGTAVQSVWLTMSELICTDISGNLFDGRAPSAYGSTTDTAGLVLYRPRLLTADTTRPSIEAILWSTYDLYVYWDDVVSLSTLQESKFVIGSFESVQVVSLDSVTVLTTSNSHMLHFNIYPIAQRFSSINRIGVGQENCNLYLQSAGAIKSVNGASSVAMDRYSPIRDGNAVVAFHLDMGTALLSFEMAYAAEYASFLPSLLSLIRPSDGIAVQLTGVLTWKIYQGKFMEMYLSDADMQSIQSKGTLTEKADGLFLVVPAAALSERTTNRKLSRQFTVPCLNLIPDTSRPQVSRFDLNMGTGVMTVYFSEPVLLSSVSIENFYIASSRVDSPAQVVRLSQALLLTESTFTTSTVSSVSIALENGPHPTDRDRMHLAGIGLSAISVNLYISEGSIADTSTPPNYLLQVGFSEAVAVSLFIADKVRPQLTGFVLDMHTRKLILTFDEAVDPTSNKPNYYTLIQNPFDTDGKSHKLTDSVTSVSSFVATSNVISIDLSDFDIDAMMFMYANLATGIDNSFLTVLPSAIRDISPSSNGNPEIFYVFAMSASRFYLDRSPPRLTRFDFSLDAGLLTLYFNEVMRCSLTNASGVLFQQSSFSGSSSHVYRLKNEWSTVLPCNSDLSRVVQIKLGKIEILSVKSKSLLMKSESHSYLRFQKGTFFDVNENSAHAIEDGRAIAVTSFTGDSEAPRMIGFSATRQGLLYLYFSEPVYRASFNLTHIALQDDEDDHPFPRYELRANHMMRLRDDEYYSYLARVDLLQMVFVINMQRDYLEQIHLSYMFTSQETTFLQYRTSLVTDMSGNSIIPMPHNNPINVGPALVLWNLDLNLNTLTLAFTENVSAAFSPAGIKIQNDATDPNITVVLSGTSGHFEYTSAELEMYTYIQITLAFADVMSLRLSGLLDNVMSPKLFLSCKLNLTQAESPASLGAYPYKSTAVHSFDALPIGDFWPDTLGPSCIFYDLNMNTGHLNLFFSEIVDAGSLDITKISLLSFVSGAIFKLTGIASVVQSNYTIVSIQLSASDLCYTKRALRGGIFEYMLLEEGAIFDSSGNSIMSNNINSLISIRTYVPDTSPPTVIEFVYDQNEHTIQLTFDEEVDLNSLQQIKVWILNASEAGEAVQLSNYTVLRNDDAVPPRLPTTVILDLGLLQIDADRLDSADYTAKNIATTFVQLHEVRDIVGNKMIGTESYPCTEFVHDTIPPQIVSFDFTDTGISTDIVLYFSEVIELVTFSCDDFSFSSAQDFSASAIVPITGSGCTLNSVVNGRSVSITVLSSLFAASFIGSSVGTTWAFVSRPHPQSQDISGNALVPSTAAVRVGPHVSDFIVDANSGRITIVFSKEVDTTWTLALDGFGFFAKGSGRHVQLSTDGNAPTVSGYRGSVAGLDSVIELSLSPLDLNRIKSIVPLSDDVFMTVAADSIFDAARVSVTPIEKSDSFLAIDLIPDSIRPQLMSAVLNMSTNAVFLEFDEPILLSSIKPYKLVLQSSLTSDEEKVQLTGASVVWGNDVGTIIIFELLFSDAVLLKLHSDIGSDIGTTFLSFSFDFLTDTAGNSIMPILPTAAYQFDGILEDTLHPSLTTFDLNMDAGVLTLYFSEPMKASSIDVTKITLQNKYYIVQQHLINGSMYRLTSGDVSAYDSYVITIDLSDLDVLRIKNSWNLARLQTSSYLLVERGVGHDIAGNDVVAIVNGFAMLCSSFTEDSVRPNVTTVSLDYNTGVLRFQFTEPILLDTVNPTRVTLFGAPQYSVTNEADFYTLTSETVVAKPNFYPISEIVSLILSRRDLNNIRSRYPLGFTTSTTFITASDLFCEDTSNNVMWAIAYWSLNDLAKDVTPPVLEYYSLDMSQVLPLIALTFSEAIDPHTINPKDCVIQSYPERRFGSFVNMARTAVEVGTGALSSSLFIHLDFDTANEMKWNGIGQFADSGNQVAKSGLLSWGRDFFKDFGNNLVLPVYDRSIPGSSSNPIVPDEFLRDDLAPELYMWFFEEKKGAIFFRFSEPVRVIEISMLKILISANGGLSSGVYSVPESSLLNYSTSFGSTVIIHNLGNDLLAAFKARSPNDETFVHINSSAIHDLSAIPNYLPLVELRSEGAPICDALCPEGQYMAHQCTLSEDRVCAPCSSCPKGEYQFAACTAFADTQCTGKEILSLCLVAIFI